MSDLINTPAHRAARNAASIALADAGDAASTIRLYDAPAGTLLAVRGLKKPCGIVRPSDSSIELHQADADDLIAADGAAAWGEWCNGDGVAISAGHVTDADGNITVGDVLQAHPAGVGPFVLTGTTGTQLYAGGVLRLTTTLIG